MNADDIKGLIDDARCINNCIPIGMQLPALIALLFDANSGAIAPCVNLIPEGSVYDVDGQFGLSLLLTPGTTYQIIFGGNDLEFLNTYGNPIDLLPPGTFQFTSESYDSAYLIGTPNSSVTATICAV